MRMLIFICLAIAQQSHAQSRLFMARMEKELPAKDSVFAIEEVRATEEEFDFLAQGIGQLETLFLGRMHALSRNRPDELSRSKVLTLMAKTTTSLWKGGQYNKGKSWVSVRKYLRRASYLSTCRFNMLRCAVFRVQLVDNEGKQFYYDRDGSPDALNLFKGNFPTYKERMDEDAPEPEPLHFFSEEEIMAQFDRQLRKQSQYSDLSKGNFCCVGVSVELDQNTLHRKKIPTARVMVVFGARRLKHVKPDSQATRNLANLDLEN